MFKSFSASFKEEVFSVDYLLVVRFKYSSKKETVFPITILAHEMSKTQVPETKPAGWDPIEHRLVNFLSPSDPAQLVQQPQQMQ